MNDPAASYGVSNRKHFYVTPQGAGNKTPNGGFNMPRNRMKKITSLILTTYFVFAPVNPAFARNIKILDDNVQTIHNSIEARIYAYKKTRNYTAVEIGFTNPNNGYMEFTPTEIYLDDEVKYSLPLLSVDQIHSIEHKKSSAAIIPVALGVGLGIAAIATSRSSHNLSFGLAMGALGAGGAALLTKGFENKAHRDKLITFTNNTLGGIKRLPTFMTLGGVLYFPPTKKPKSITIIAQSSSGKYEKKVFDLTQAKKMKR